MILQWWWWWPNPVGTSIIKLFGVSMSYLAKIIEKLKDVKRRKTFFEGSLSKKKWKQNFQLIDTSWNTDKKLKLHPWKKGTETLNLKTTIQYVILLG